MAERRPGDFILDTHMPLATAQEREVARDTMCRLIALISRVQARLDDDCAQAGPRAERSDAVDSESHLTIV